MGSSLGARQGRENGKGDLEGSNELAGLADIRDSFEWNSSRFCVAALQPKRLVAACSRYLHQTTSLLTNTRCLLDPTPSISARVYHLQILRSLVILANDTCDVGTATACSGIGVDANVEWSRDPIVLSLGKNVKSGGTAWDQESRALGASKSCSQVAL
jgi:hypothetical protein